MLIFVSGPPGAGKTTLATAIAEQLHLPHLNRDRIYEGLRHAAADPSLPVVPAGIHAFRVVLENLLREGVSVVADATLYAGTSEPDINCLLEISDALNLHCEAPAALARFGARLETDPRRHGYTWMRSSRWLGTTCDTHNRRSMWAGRRSGSIPQTVMNPNSQTSSPVVAHSRAIWCR